MNLRPYAIIQSETIFGILLEPEEVAHLQMNNIKLVKLKSNNITEEIKNLKKEIGEPYVFKEEKNNTVRW